MVKRKTRCCTMNISHKKQKNEHTKNPRKKITVPKNQKKREIIKKGRQMLKRMSSSNYSSQSSGIDNSARKKYLPKQYYCRVDKKNKEKKAVQKNKLRTCYENPNYSGSNESLRSHITHLHVNESRYVHKSSLNTNHESCSSYSSILPDDKVTENLQRLAEIDGTKLVKDNADGTSTEIMFQPALLMRVRKTPANVDVRPDNQAKPVCTSNYGQEISGEPSSLYRQIFGHHNSNPSKMPVHKCSVSKATVLGIKSSRNFTDINSQRKIQGLTTSERPYFPSTTEIHEIMPHQLIKSSNVDINVDRTRSPKNCNALNEPVSTQIQFSRNTFPCIANPLGPKCSQLHSAQMSSKMRNIPYDIHQSCSHDTIYTQITLQEQTQKRQ